MASLLLCPWPQQYPDDRWNELITPVDVTSLHHFLLFSTSSLYLLHLSNCLSSSLHLLSYLCPIKPGLISKSFPCVCVCMCVWVANRAQRDFISALSMLFVPLPCCTAQPWAIELVKKRPSENNTSYQSSSSPAKCRMNDDASDKVMLLPGPGSRHNVLAFSNSVNPSPLLLSNRGRKAH